QGQIYSRWVRLLPNGTEDAVRPTQKVAIPTGRWDVRVYVRWAPLSSDSSLRATVSVDENTTGDQYVHVMPSAGTHRPTAGRVMVRDHYGIQDIVYAQQWVNRGQDLPEIINRSEERRVGKDGRSRS